jgi:hypothetical protein
MPTLVAIFTARNWRPLQCSMHVSTWRCRGGGAAPISGCKNGSHCRSLLALAEALGTKMTALPCQMHASSVSFVICLLGYMTVIF